MCASKKQNNWVCFSVCTHTPKKKKEIVGLHVRVDQEFLPSQSGPIRWALTCALTPLRGRISEHGNTKSGKRKTLIDFACFLMCLPQGPAVLKQLLKFLFFISFRLQLPSNADVGPVLWSDEGLFSAHVPQVSWSRGFFWLLEYEGWLTDGSSDWWNSALLVSKTTPVLAESTCAVDSVNRWVLAVFSSASNSVWRGFFLCFYPSKSSSRFQSRHHYPSTPDDLRLQPSDWVLIWADRRFYVRPRAYNSQRVIMWISGPLSLFSPLSQTTNYHVANESFNCRNEVLYLKMMQVNVV